MAKVLDSGVHSMILTSGTLAPLAATIRELNIGNPIILESPHIISPDQVSISSVLLFSNSVESFLYVESVIITNLYAGRQHSVKFYHFILVVKNVYNF